jgi:hypothetical protein
MNTRASINIAAACEATRAHAIEFPRRHDRSARVLAMRHAEVRGRTRWEETLRKCARGSTTGM